MRLEIMRLLLIIGVFVVDTRRIIFESDSNCDSFIQVLDTGDALQSLLFWLLMLLILFVLFVFIVVTVNIVVDVEFDVGFFFAVFFVFFLQVVKCLANIIFPCRRPIIYRMLSTLLLIMKVIIVNNVTTVGGGGSRRSRNDITGVSTMLMSMLMLLVRMCLCRSPSRTITS